VTFLHEHGEHNGAFADTNRVYLVWSDNRSGSQGTTYTGRNQGDIRLARGLGGYGQSSLFYARGGCPLCAPPDIPRPLIGLTSFSVLAPVPEASSWALLLLGLALGGSVRRRITALVRTPMG
jgi:hypothetical protein